MTLYRQIAILVSFLLVTILISILMIIFNTIINSSQDSLYKNAQNSATSLSLSLASSGGDKAMMSTIINANFDNSNMEKIVLTNMQGELIYERLRQKNKLNIPVLFLNLISFEAPEAVAQVSSGWKLIGILSIKSDVNVVYLELYKTFKYLVSTFLVVSFVALVALNLLLHFILKPLVGIRKQAESILNNEFIIQKKEVFTLDFQDIVKSMNSMVERVENIFKEGNKALSFNKDLLYKDHLTNLYNREYLILKLNEYLSPDNVNNGGVIIMLSISDTAKINKLFGHQKTDDLFRVMAKQIIESTAHFNDAVVSRLNGSEFNILIPQIALVNCELLLKEISKEILDLFEYFTLNEKNIGVHIGATAYSLEQQIAEVFASVDYALAQAELLDFGQYYLQMEDSTEIKGKEQWREILKNAIQNSQIKILNHAVVELETNKNIHFTTSLSLVSENRTYKYGEFIALAMKLDMLDELNIYLLKNILLDAQKLKEQRVYSIQLNASFLEGRDSVYKLKEILQQIPKNISTKAIFEIPESTVCNNLEHSSSIIELIRSHNFDFGISNFIAESKDFAYLKDLQPLFLKSNKDFLLKSSATSLSTLNMFLASLSIKLIATGVNTKDELEQLKKLDIKIIQGAMVDTL
ncbi:MAG: EAL domain-containing protein [Helicobacteraceae bacterium]|nr:EAL domain-containing protein [Helicobacteraceae bacterium]